MNVIAILAITLFFPLTLYAICFCIKTEGRTREGEKKE